MENIFVTGEFGRKPALAFEGTPSDELVVEVLRAGDGQVVEAGDTITCHYYGAVFGSATDFDNSFDRGGALSFQIGVGMVIPGWDEGLVGKRVGDRVLLSIPAELGYGARGVPQAGIPGGATLACVKRPPITRGEAPGRQPRCERGTRSRQDSSPGTAGGTPRLSRSGRSTRAKEPEISPSGSGRSRAH